MKGLNLPKRHIYLGPASILRRLIALITDLLIIDMIIAAPFKKKLLALLPQVTSFGEIQAAMKASESIIAQASTIIVAISILVLFYFALMQTILTQTPGMMLMNVYVIRAEKKAIKKPTFWQCILRNLFLLPFFPFFILWITEPVFLLFSKTRQRFLEVISGTLTVEEYNS
jgi:uncharacterized RDD family membrane protein YckC